MNKKCLLVYIFCCFLLQPSVHAGQKVKITFLSPQTGSIWMNEKTIEISVDGITADRILKTEIFVDGRLIGELHEPPFRITHNFGSSPRYHYITALIKDVQGNSYEEILGSLRIDDYQEVNVSQIIIPVVVTDGRGNYITNLNKDDFLVEVDGLPQTVSHISREGSASLHMVLLIDVSSSMKDKIAAVKEAAKNFLKELLGDEVKAIVVFFNHDVFEDTEFTNETDTLDNSISLAFPFGATALYDAIAYSYKLLTGIPGHKVIVIFSDGEDNSSHMDPFSLMAKVEKSNTVVYAIGNESAQTDTQYQQILEKITTSSGGITFLLDEIGQIQNVYYNIRTDIKAQYVISFSYDGHKKLNRFRKVSVRVAKRRYQVRTVKGFYH